MNTYKNTENSGIIGWESPNKDTLKVWFKRSEYVYVYTANSVGSQNRLDTMKELARQGEGLSGFISKYVKKDFERKERI